MESTPCSENGDPNPAPATGGVGIVTLAETAGGVATARRARRRVNPATLTRITEAAATAAVEAFYRPAPQAKR